MKRKPAQAPPATASSEPPAPLRVDAKLLRPCHACDAGSAVGSHGLVPCSSCHGTQWLLVKGMGVTAAPIDLARKAPASAEVATMAIHVVEHLLVFRGTVATSRQGTVLLKGDGAGALGTVLEFYMQAKAGA